MDVMLIVLLMFSGTAMLGAWIAWQFWTGGKPFRGAGAVHLLIAAAALEGLALMLRGAPDGSTAPDGRLGPAAALLLAGAFLSGLIIPLVAKPRPAALWPAVLTHASIATLGLGALILWLV